jgi:hypothetical protein
MGRMKSSVVCLVLILLGCGGSMTVIPRSGGQPLQASFQDGVGQTSVVIMLPTGEVMQGSLIWIPPGGQVTTVVLSTTYGAGFGSGMSSGTRGYYIGSIAGSRGTVMRIEMMCNTFTMRCVGAGRTNDGTEYDIQR